MASRELVVPASEMMALTPSVAAAAIVAAQSETAAARAALATQKDEILAIVKEIITSGATDLLGSSIGTQLFERIEQRFSLAPSPAPPPRPILLTGTTMYQGRGAPRRSDYMLPDGKVLKPCAPNSPKGAELYQLEDGSVRSLSSLSPSSQAANAV